MVSEYKLWGKFFPTPVIKLLNQTLLVGGVTSLMYMYSVVHVLYISSPIMVNVFPEPVWPL